MSTFIFTHRDFPGKLTFKYNEAGILKTFEVEGGLSDARWEFVLTNFPVDQSQLPRFEKLSQGKIILVPEDLSFGAFWTKYNYKVGNKPRAEKLWNLMSEAERSLALQVISAYDRFLSEKRNQEKAYPETWLYQRRFENSFIIK